MSEGQTGYKPLGYNFKVSQGGNPAPIGLTGFGLTTILLNLHNAGFFPLNSMILAMGIFIGGAAQMIAGRLEFQKGNTFACTAFTLYGSFWLSLVFIFLFPQGLGAVKPMTPGAMGAYLLFWGIFSGFMTIGTLKSNLVLRFIFITLTILFFLLAVENFLKAGGLTSAAEILGVIAGWEGIICGSSACYLAVAEVINEIHNRNVLPIGG